MRENGTEVLAILQIYKTKKKIITIKKEISTKNSLVMKMFSREHFLIGFAPPS